MNVLFKQDPANVLEFICLVNFLVQYKLLKTNWEIKITEVTLKHRE